MTFIFERMDRLLLVLVVGVGALNAVASAFVAVLLQQVLDLALMGDQAGFVRLLVMTVVYVAALALLSLAEAVLSKWLLNRVSQNLRKKVFHGILRLRPEAFDRRSAAEYLSAVLNDVKLIEDNLIIPLLECSAMIMLFLATLGILLWLSPLVTAILVGLLLLMLFLPLLMNKALQHRQTAYSESLAKFTALTQDFLHGFAVIRGFAAGGAFERRFNRQNHATAQAKWRADLLLALNETTAAVLSVAGSIVIVFVAAWQVLRGDISAGTLLALIQLSGTFSTPVLMIMQQLPKIQSVQSVLAELEKLARDDGAWEAELRTVPDGWQESVALQDVGFAYEGMKPVLRSVSLTLRKGDKVALLGTSGGGKSTLIRLMTGYSPRYEGSICYDGREVRVLSRRDLQQRVAVLEQDVTLFDMSVRDNICLDASFSEAALVGALEKSGVAHFLDGLAAGLDTGVGANGCRLSGGQRQRVALARALIRRPPLLILDEGTAAIDPETAVAIETTLLADPDLTLLTITHHLSDEMAAHYDAVHRLQDGRLQGGV